LLKGGFKADAVLKMEWTALHVAAKAGQAKIGALLLERGAKVNALTEMRQTALDVALASDKSEMAELLKTHGGRRSAELWLHSAVMAGDLKWVKKHLAAGADINGKDRGELPLCLALARCKWEVASFLLKKGADVHKRQESRNMALHEAVAAGAEVSVLKALLDLGADVNAVGQHGKTPLCLAAGGGLDDAAEFLIQKGADTAYLTKTGSGPVTEAIEHDHHCLARWLIDNGGRCSLPYAVECGHLTEARRLLSEGADVRETRECRLDSPMAMAIQDDSVEMAKLLLEFGANVNEQEPI